MIANQFERIRNGDRFWYQNTFSGSLLSEIQRTKLSDVIARNTTLKNVQPNVFVFDTKIEGAVIARNRPADPRAKSPSMAAPNPPSGQPIAGWTIALLDRNGLEVALTKTDATGRFRFDTQSGLKTGLYSVQIVKDPLGSPVDSREPKQTLAITKGDQNVLGVRLVLPLAKGTPAPQINGGPIPKGPTQATDAVFAQMGR
jgi:hypothetical protein